MLQYIILFISRSRKFHIILLDLGECHIEEAIKDIFNSLIKQYINYPSPRASVKALNRHHGDRF